MPPLKSKTIRNITLLAGSMMTVLSSALLSPALPDMALAFQTTPNADLLVRLTLTMPSLFLGIGSLFSGILLDRWGRKPVIMISLILFGLAGAAGFVLNSLPAILVSRALLGMAMAGTTNGFITLITDYFTGENLNRFMGYHGAGMGIGAMVFQLIAGYLADFGWRYPFLVYAYAFIVLIGVFVMIDEPVIVTQESTNGPSAEQATTAKLPWKPIILLLISGFFSMVALFAIFVFIPFRLAAIEGVSNFMIGLALSLQTLMSIGTALQYERLKNRLPHEAIMALVFLSMGLNHVLVSLTESYGVMIAALMIGGLGLGLLAPCVNVWIAELSPPAWRGRSISGLTVSFALGQFFTPLLLEPVFSQFGDAIAFRIIGIGTILIAMFFGMSLLRNKPEQAAKPA